MNKSIQVKEIVDSHVKIEVSEESKRNFGRKVWLSNAVLVAALGVDIAAVLSLTVTNTYFGRLFLTALFLLAAGYIYKKHVAVFYQNTLSLKNDPYAFAEYSYIYMSRFVKKVKNTNKRRIRQDMSLLYYMCNALRYQKEENWETAVEMMEEYKDWEKDGFAGIYYHHFMAAYYNYKKDLKKLEEQIAKIEELAKGMKKRNALIIEKNWLRNLKENAGLLRMELEGNKRGCYEMCRILLANAGSRLNRAILNYRTGVLALDLKDYAAAGKYLTKAAEDANKLFFKADAERLKKQCIEKNNQC